MKGHLCNWGEQCPLFKSWHRTMHDRVVVFDNYGDTADRYTVLIRRKQNGKNVVDVFTMSDEPTSPLGIDRYSHTIQGNYTRHNHGNYRQSENDKRVKVIDLPPDVIRAIEHRI